MPHGPLTPLGKQLRSVLAAIRPSGNARRYVSPALGQGPALRCLSHNDRQQNAETPHRVHLDAPRRRQHAAAAVAQFEVPPNGDHNAAPSNNVRNDGLSRRRLARRTRMDCLSQELAKAGRKHATPRRRRRWNVDLSYYNPSDRGSRRKLRENERRHKHDFIPKLDHVDHAASTDVFKVLARYVRFLGGKMDAQREPDSWAAFDLSVGEKQLLQRKGYIMDDIKAWALIVMEEDSYAAALALQTRVTVHGMKSVPLGVATYILRRQYVNARALRILIDHAWDRFASVERDTGRPPDPVSRSVVVNNLLRHAREVWPQALDAIVEHMLRFTPNVAQYGAKDSTKMLSMITFHLNKAMKLMSMPTTLSPYKDIRYQETAIVRVLSYMANHSPALQINRDGYRAVVRIQLAQKKTESEEKWAALKSLSWPPWKEDRTRMDALIGPDQGVSKAGETLDRMKEAGYQPEAWEQLAQVYTGWDVDGTPTIQTRALISTNVDDTSLEAAVWAARIRTTRTVQEAWACYLAYEDTKLPTDERVIMAMFRMLNQEERRKWAEREQLSYPKQDLEQSLPIPHPGDLQEIQPLPPSSHLYTYTRSSPPTVHEFYLQLRDQNADIGDGCLAFLVANANNFGLAVEYLRTVYHKYVTSQSSTRPGTESQAVHTPWVLLDAYIILLSRHPSVNFYNQRDFMPEISKMFGFGFQDHHNLKFNMHHPLGQAMGLIRARRPRTPRVWNAVATALADGRANPRSHLVYYDIVARDTKQNGADQDRNAITAYRLFRHMQDLYRRQHMDLDPQGFLIFCRAVESVTIASWKIARRDDHSSVLDSGPYADPDEETKARLAAEGFTHEDRPYRRLQYHFKLLVGQDPKSGSADARSRPSDPDGPRLPALLHAPGPAMLHGYIRALGWCAAYSQILDTLRWMAQHRTELDEAREKDRNGVAVTRRAVVAIRVFMERAWMERKADRASKIAHQSNLLRRFEEPASTEQLQEAQSLLEEWGGWATDDEVRRYCRDARFKPFR